MTFCSILEIINIGLDIINFCIENRLEIELIFQLVRIGIEAKIAKKYKKKQRIDHAGKHKRR
jgi:hypothetical protein